MWFNIGLRVYEKVFNIGFSKIIDTMKMFDTRIIWIWKETNIRCTLGKSLKEKN